VSTWGLKMSTEDIMGELKKQDTEVVSFAKVEFEVKGLLTEYSVLAMCNSKNLTAQRRNTHLDNVYPNVVNTIKGAK